MDQQFIAEVLKRDPTYRVVKGHFVVPPVDHVVAGFFCDKTPSGAYIWEFAFPLYDRRADRISLTFGDRLPLPAGFFDVTRASDDLAAEFVHRTRDRRALVESWKTPSGFLRHLEALGGQSNPWVKRARATTLALLGRGDEALTILEPLAGNEVIERYPGFKADICTLVESLQSDEETARNVLLQWEDVSKRNLGLVRR